MGNWTGEPEFGPRPIDQQIEQRLAHILRSLQLLVTHLTCLSVCLSRFCSAWPLEAWVEFPLPRIPEKANEMGWDRSSRKVSRWFYSIVVRNLWLNSRPELSCKMGSHLRDIQSLGYNLSPSPSPSLSWNPNPNLEASLGGIWKLFVLSAEPQLANPNEICLRDKISSSSLSHLET